MFVQRLGNGVRYGIGLGGYDGGRGGNNVKGMEGCMYVVMNGGWIVVMID